ncbi:MAG TPA: trigger factor, partial [Clostridiales bacterium]|nr:trigger factor [Clostridiales bacterium]
RINSLTSEFGHSLQQQGMNLDMYLQYTGMGEEEFRATFAERAEKEVVLRLGLEKIAEMENLTVTDEEIEEGLTKLGEQNGMDLETVKKYISYDAYKLDLLVGKAADVVKENAAIDNTLVEVETEVTED